MKLTCASTALAIVFAMSAFAGDWPQWRGARRDGMSSETISTNWGEGGPPVIWRAAVGIGFSSVSIAKERAYTMGNTNNQDTIWCFDASSGRVVWTNSYTAKLDPQWYEGGPGATPTIFEDRVFTISKAGDVLCLDAATGAVIWRRDLREDGLKAPRWGYAGSPLIWRNLVFYHVGAAGLALDRNSGQTIWFNGTNSAAGYASPTLLHEETGKAYLLLFVAKHLVCVEPSTGKEIWRRFWETGWDTNITDPLVWSNQVFISSFTRGCALLDLSQAEPKTIYESKVLLNHLSPGIRIGDYLYAFSGEAKQDTDFRCIEVRSGEVKWKTKDPAFGSMLLAGDLLLVLSDKGELIAGRAAPEGFTAVARAKVLSGTCWIPPALSNGRLYVRNAKGELLCLNLEP